MEYKDYLDAECVEEEELEACDEECSGGQGGSDNRAKRKLIEVEEVIDFGTAETNVEICVPLCPPAFEVMVDLITKEVVFDALVASKGKVFINGRIFKDIPYKTKEKVCIPGCENITKATFGDIRHVTVEVPFALCVDVPKACKGQKVVVLDYEVNSVEIPNFTKCIANKCVPVCEPAYLKKDSCMRRLYKSVTEKDCISVKVKVVKDTIISVPVL
ncbi:hypothetical protein OXPF_37070 [Oxobacter pfennigii]|uniref:SipL SPOCS domain-containing protein n=1 Tax=Oxobacter pfennigii TaxID=36849 RepID=A0A0P8W505_9CLOT|nr:hypothetical protein [Oxobacter pfennigii]KPU42938.1 hypothetical protein OXPF_37070 [Oxobacter pfennigii]